MIQKPKGTYDVNGIQGRNILYIEKLLHELMVKYNYEYLRTPIFEATELFHRGVGETTDIVSKETYDFTDRGNRNMTLRPEGTAGIVRSFIENKMYGNTSLPVKTWYYGPMYRYERPQSGRFREFYQFGVEAFGSNDPLMDAEIISIPVNLYKLLGLQNVKVKINSLGDTESRNKYREALKDYFKPYMKELCEDCNNRLDKNPLRILDCKIDMDKDILKNAPKMIDYLSDESINHFERVKEYLEAIEIEYTEDQNLVRGLDYYTYTVFEVEADIKGFGSNNVLCGGGRYNNLVENIGGPSTPGVGFAIGIERLLSALEAEDIKLIKDNNVDLYIAPMTEYEKGYAFALLQDLRMNGFKVEMDYMNRKLDKNFKQADRLNAKFVAIIGETEITENYITIKNNKTKEEFKVELEYIINFLDEKILEDEYPEFNIEQHHHDCSSESHECDCDECSSDHEDCKCKDNGCE